MACTDMLIRVLVDNRAAEGLAAEHGFSLWLEVSGRRVLFDTGQGAALVPNAAALGCDLSQVDVLLLSHGHYDHTGAVADVVRLAPSSRIFCHSNVFVPRYSIRPDEAPRAISMALPSGEALFSVPDGRVQWVTRPRLIADGIGISGPVPRRHSLEDTGGPFFLDPDGCTPDSISDDLSLWIETPRGLVVFTGCCHSGLVNTVEHIREASGVEKIHGIIGGLHLVNASRERIEFTCSALREWNPAFVVPCHCTGEEANSYLRAALGDRVTAGYAGLTFDPIRGRETPGPDSGQNAEQRQGIIT